MTTSEFVFRFLPDQPDPANPKTLLPKKFGDFTFSVLKMHPSRHPTALTLYDFLITKHNNDPSKQEGPYRFYTSLAPSGLDNNMSGLWCKVYIPWESRAELKNELIKQKKIEYQAWIKKEAEAQGITLVEFKKKLAETRKAAAAARALQNQSAIVEQVMDLSGPIKELRELLVQYEEAIAGTRTLRKIGYVNRFMKHINKTNEALRRALRK